MYNDIKEILISEERIEKRCKELGKLIDQDYQDKCPLLVGFLKGCVPFLAELIKHISIHLEYDFMDIDSYFGGTQSSGQIKIVKDLNVDIKGRDILIIEDIVDTGYTLHTVLPILKERGAATIEIVTLLDKPDGRLVDDINPKYVGFNVPKAFLVGFGLDYKQKYRNLPFVGILKEEVYK
ncbi:MAG: hypoxanthine phosphoribosyltransferase [Bacilli bacterium]